MHDLYLKQEGKCYYLGCDMVVSQEFKFAFNLLTVDRIDSSKGYTKDNVVLCCWCVNRAKSVMPHDVFIEMCRRISERFICNDDGIEEQKRFFDMFMKLPPNIFTIKRERNKDKKRFFTVFREFPEEFSKDAYN